MPSSISTSHVPLPAALAADGALASDLLSMLVAQSTQSIIVGEVHPNGEHRIIHANPAFTATTGFTEEEARKAAIESLLAPHEQVQEWADLAEKLRKGDSFDQTLRAQKRDGSSFWACLHCYPLRHQQETASHWVLIFTDITSIQEPILELRQSEERYRLLAYNSHDAITVHRFDGICIYASPAIREILGYEPEELQHRPLDSFFHPDDCMLARRVIERHFHNRSESVFTHRLRRKDGTYVWCETTSKTTWSLKGDQPGGIIAITRDISKRRLAEDELKAMHMLLSSVFESIPFGLCITDEDGIVRQCNRGFSSTLGLNSSDACGKSIRDLLPGDMLSEGVRSTELRRCNGEIFNARLSVTQLMLSPEAHLLLTLTDQTEQLVVDEKLREAQRLESLGTLAGGIAHDFNNLLAIILGYASLLRQVAPEHARVIEYGDTIMDAGRRGADVVRQLMLYANQHEPLLVDEDIHTVLGDVLVRTTAGWPEDIKLECDFSSSDSTLLLDPEHVGRAVEHLLRNARESIKGAGAVTLRTLDRETRSERDDSVTRWVEISIEDTGCGMDETTKARMFEPFFVHNKGPEVRGLGLALVYGVVRAHRGKIEVRSELGKGTHVSIHLPHEPTPASQVPISPSVTDYALKAGASVLVVEDEADIGKLWMSLLSKQGWMVYWAKDGEEALDLFAQHKDSIDLLFSDVGLPGDLDGWEVCARVRAECPSLPIMLASGYFKRNAQNHPQLSEPTVYVDKPYQPLDVFERMRTLVGHL
ncbi:MAG: PAS domain S-box protein [Opitutaceae bacterium]|jgi:PAS domain S-box-containing protein